jgi:hypothetical protein
MNIADLIATIDSRLRDMAPACGWDAPRCFLQPKDPAGRIRLQFLSHQGTISMSIRDAEAYLLWLEEGNKGTAIKWASSKGRKLS